jgi:hypothetical protein
MRSDPISEEAPKCPDCGSNLAIAWTIPRLGLLPEVRTFKCDGCDSLFTDRGEPSEPMTGLR